MIKAFVSLLIDARSKNRSCNQSWIKARVLVAGLLAPIAISLSILLIPHSAYSGGNSAGGGNPILANYDDVMMGIWSAHEKLTSSIKQLGVNNGKIKRDFRDIRVIEILEQLVRRGLSGRLDNLSYGALDQLSKRFFWSKESHDQYRLSLSVVNLKMRGWCIDNGIPNTGGAYIGDTVSKICLSLPGLMKLPASDLVNEIAGLMLHEYVHQYGFGNETDAKAAQREFINYLKREAVIFEVQRSIGDANSRILSAIKFHREGNSGAACWALGQASGDLSKVFNFSIVRADKLPAQGLNREFYKIWDELSVQALSLSGYCGVPLEFVKAASGGSNKIVAPKGDQKYFLEQLLKFNNLIESLFAMPVF